jgi:hypothetical protein
MKGFVARNNLYLLTVLAAVVAVVTVRRWSDRPVLHLWEEGRVPGGFTDMIAARLGFTARSPHFGELITTAYVLFITLVPSSYGLAA